MTHDDLLEMFRKANVPELNDILNLLTKSGSMPQISVKNIGGYGAYNGTTNELYLSPRGGNTTTATHEMSHALDNTMNRRYLDLQSKQNLSPIQQQFKDGFEKLKPAQTKLPLGNDPYRFSPQELRSFGVGNMVDKGNPNAALGYTDVPQHLDPTMATDAAVLRELYRRMLEEK
jgi:hypothetical protein